VSREAAVDDLLELLAERLVDRFLAEQDFASTPDAERPPVERRPESQLLNEVNRHEDHST
jgi:hypothetical protein